MSLAGASAETLPTDGVLRDRDGGGRTAYLPTPTVQCHAANLAWLPNGDLACVWFGGTQEGVSDITAYLSRMPSGSDTWLPPVPLSDDPTRSEQNPVLFTAPGGDVWLLYTAQLAGNLAITQRKHPVCAFLHLAQAMRNVNHRNALRLEVGDDLHKRAGFGQCQRRGRFVHDDDASID